MKWLAAVLSVFVVLAAGDARAGQDDATCAFDYVLQGGLITEEFTEVTPELQQGSKFAEVLRQRLAQSQARLRFARWVPRAGRFAFGIIAALTRLGIHDHPVQTRKS